jgi:hypothetical protein
MVMVVALYNAQVTALRDALTDNVRVGTTAVRSPQMRLANALCRFVELAARAERVTRGLRAARATLSADR